MTTIETFNSLTSNGKINYIESIKMSILGNCKEKQCISTQLELFKNILLKESDPILLKSTATIIQSFSFSKECSTYLIENGIIEVLIQSTLRQFNALADINLRSIVNLLSTSSLFSINLNDYQDGPKLISLLNRVLFSECSSSSLLRSVYLLVPLIKKGNYTVSKLYKGLMKRLAHATTSLFRTVLQLNNTENDISSFRNSLQSEMVPQPPSDSTLSTFSDELCPLFLSVTYLLSISNEETGITSLSIPLQLYYTATSLLNAYDTHLNLAAANLLTQYTIHYVDEEFKEINFFKIVPSLVNLIHRTEDNKNNADSTIDSTYRISREMSPIYLLSLICKECTKVDQYLVDTNFLDKIAHIVTSNYSADQKFLDEQSLYRISDALLVLACVGAEEENYRELIVEYDVSTIIVDSLSRHVAIHESLNSQAILSSNELLILKLSTEITLSSCYLLRSLSRSASLMRTFLLELNLSDYLINALKTPYEHLPDELKYNEILLKSILLGIIANLVIEFSALKKDLANRDLVSILQNIIDHSPYDILRCNALLVIRNSIYKEVNRQLNKLFLEAISLDKYFALCDYPDDNIQEKSMNVLRNFSVAEYSYSTKIWIAYSVYAREQGLKETTFFAFLLRHLNEAKSTSMIEGIGYTVAHFAASTLDNKILLMCHEDLLLKLLDLLKFKINSSEPGKEDALQWWRVKNSIIWVVINLTWIEETRGNDISLSPEDNQGGDDMDIDSSLDINPSDFDNYSVAKNRAVKLVDLGFYDVLKNISDICSDQDVKERARTAIFQLVLHDTNIATSYN